MEANRGMGFQLAKTLALGSGLKGGPQGAPLFHVWAVEDGMEEQESWSFPWNFALQG